MMREYHARKRTVALRSSLLLAGLASLVATRSPILGWTSRSEGAAAS